ncbi:type II toxin-antitoxin system VapC family toxin [Patescibacteria group bacterium]|nr:type II toxin-antitoxin system VapC family toxin [Patescibacteria group bacterium]MBU1885814.1 type II toxin-antitoxin system VapC family toxin [Patescibacteria group bacterium]
MKTFFADTSVFIEMSRTGEGVFKEVLRLASHDKAKLFVSVVVVAEYWAGKSMNFKANREEGKILFEKFEVIDVSLKIAKKAGEIRRKHNTDLPDALIAATALEHNAQLATLNTKHFENIPGLKIWQPKVFKA